MQQSLVACLDDTAFLEFRAAGVLVTVRGRCEDVLAFMNERGIPAPSAAPQGYNVMDYLTASPRGRITLVHALTRHPELAGLPVWSDPQAVVDLTLTAGRLAARVAEQWGLPAKKVAAPEPFRGLGIDVLNAYAPHIAAAIIDQEDVVAAFLNWTP